MPEGTLKIRSDRAAAVSATPHEINATGSFAAFWLASEISSVSLTAGIAISLYDYLVRVVCKMSVSVAWRTVKDPAVAI